MCYSASASAASFFIQLACCLVLFLLPKQCCGSDRYSKKDNWVFAFVILGISTMQVAEWIMHLDPDCGDKNITGAQFGFMSLLILQPAFSLVGMTLFGTERKLYGVNVLPLLWLVCMVVYTAGASAAMDNGLNLHYSKTLDRNVSQWCTVDKTCEGDMCDLNWNWDNINVEWRFWFYWGVVLILPVVSLDNWLIWAVILTAHAIWSYILGTKPGNVISSASASCFWAPIVTLLIQLSTLPQIIQKCSIKSTLGQDREPRTNLEPRYELVGIKQ